MEQAVETARRAAASALEMIREQRGSILSLPGWVLFDAIGQVSSAVDVTGDTPVLKGVMVEAVATEFRLVTTHLYRLAVRTLVAEVVVHQPVAAVVVASELGRAPQWIGDQDIVRLRFPDSCLRLAGSKGSWKLQILKETFPAPLPTSRRRSLSPPRSSVVP